MPRKSKSITPVDETPSSENSKTIKWHGIELGMPDKIPTPEDLALLRGFEPKG